MSVESKIQELLEQAENLENSSEDLSLTEEDLELFSEEELNELIENMDQLDELSKSTLGSYIKKAAGSMATNYADERGGRQKRSEFQGKAGDLGMSFNDTEKALEKKNLDMKSLNKLTHNVGKRFSGINKAASRLTQEDVDTDNAAALTAKVRAKAKQQDKTDLDDMDYENSEHPHGKEYNIKKDPSFDKGERTEVMESIDLGDLFEGQDLTEDFKDKITTVFEAAVAARVTQELDRVTEELIEANVEEVALFKEGLIEKIDGYLGLMTEQWMQKNELALERGVKADLFESLVSSMKNVFTEHYITVPEDKFDVLETVQEELEQMKARLNESTANNVQLSNTLKEISRNMQIDEAADGLSEIQAEKFRALAENIVYHDEDSFAEKLDIIKENYFSEREQRIERGTIFSDEPVELTEETTQPQLSPEMKAYTQILR